MIDLTGTSEDDYERRVAELVAPVNDLIRAAQDWSETKEIEAAMQALARHRAVGEGFGSSSTIADRRMIRYGL